MLLDTQRERIKNNNIDCVGCSLKEIESKEKELNVKFPDVYKQFLNILGKDQGHFFCGDTVSLHHLQWINKWGRRTYFETLGLDPSNMFFILEHQVYSFYYFDLQEEENPTIHMLVVGDEVHQGVVGKLDGILEKEIDRLVK